MSSPATWSGWRRAHEQAAEEARGEEVDVLGEHAEERAHEEGGDRLGSVAAAEGGDEGGELLGGLAADLLLAPGGVEGARVLEAGAQDAGGRFVVEGSEGDLEAARGVEGGVAGVLAGPDPEALADVGDDDEGGGPSGRWSA